MDVFVSKQYTHLHAFANIFKMSAKARRALFVRLNARCIASLEYTPLGS